MRALLGDDADLLEVLEENPLPASYHLELASGHRSPEAVAAIAEDLRRWPEVDDVVYSEAWVGALERWAVLFRWGSLMVSLVVLGAAVFVISNTVRLTMAGSRRLIEIQMLVGATNTFIRLPYLLEGMVHGLLAGVLAMAVLAAGFKVLAVRLDGLTFFTPAQVTGFVLFCVLLGLLGSLAAIGQYLRLRRIV